MPALPHSGKVHTLFNTHWHPEQTGSNQRLGAAGATIVAQENTRLWLTQDITWPWNGKKFAKFPKIAQPNKTFYDKGALDSGIRYGYIADAAQHFVGAIHALDHGWRTLHAVRTMQRTRMEALPSPVSSLRSCTEILQITLDPAEAVCDADPDASPIRA